MFKYSRYLFIFLALQVGAPRAQVAVERFNDWDLICREGALVEALPSQQSDEKNRQANPPSEKRKDCRLIQSHALDNSKKQLVILSIAMTKKGSSGLAVMTTPQAVYLAPGIIMKIDKRKPFKILYEICNARGCHAGFKLGKQVLSAFKKGTVAKIVLWRQDSKAVEIKLSLVGFSKAYARLQELSK